MIKLLMKNTFAASLILLGANAVVAVATSGSVWADSTPILDTEQKGTAIQNETITGQTLPAMWRMSDADTTVTLFGTMHALPPGIDWQSPLYRSEMQSATTTITEADTTSAEAIQSTGELVMELGFNPPGTTLSDIIGAQRADQLVNLAEPYGLTADDLQPMRPWLASISITAAALTAAGHDFKLSVDDTVEQTARNENDEIVFLESGRLQIEAIASLDQIESEDNYDVMLEQFERVDATLEALLQAWKTGNLAELEKHIIKDLQQLSLIGYQELIVQRNLNWLKEFSRIMDEEQGHYFVAVGVGHFVGDDSVIRYLRELGFQVERIQ